MGNHSTEYNSLSGLTDESSSLVGLAENMKPCRPMNIGLIKKMFFQKLNDLIHKHKIFISLNLHDSNEIN